jgi:hypothetical protein
LALEKFHHKIGSKTIALPKFENIPFGVLRKLRKESEVEQFFGIVEEVADAKTLTTLDTLTMPEVRDLMAAWQKNSAADMGESSAS